MSIPKNKTELIEAIDITYQLLRKDLVDIPDNLTRKKDLEGHAKGNKMSVCNLVAYLVGWGELILKWHKKKKAEQDVDFPETGYKWNELGKLAQKFYADYDKDSYKNLIKKYDKVVRSILELIDTHTNHQLYGVPWYDKWTMGRMIQFNTSSPYKNARGRIRKWKKQKGLV
jgi:hypothetical protein